MNPIVKAPIFLIVLMLVSSCTDCEESPNLALINVVNFYEVSVGGLVTVEFRVTPEELFNATRGLNYSVSLERSDGGGNPMFCKLESINKVKDKSGRNISGMYQAHIRDIGLCKTYEESLQLVAVYGGG